MSYERLQVTNHVDTWDAEKLAHVEDGIIANEGMINEMQEALANCITADMVEPVLSLLNPMLDITIVDWTGFAVGGVIPVESLCRADSDLFKNEWCTLFGIETILRAGSPLTLRVHKTIDEEHKSINTYKFTPGGYSVHPETNELLSGYWVMTTYIPDEENNSVKAIIAQLSYNPVDQTLQMSMSE